MCLDLLCVFTSRCSSPGKTGALRPTSADFGQFAAEYPCIWLLHKLPIRLFVAISIIVWAVVVACQAATKNYTDMLVVRFFVSRACVVRILADPD